MNYYIGEKYKYPNSRKIFILKYVTNNMFYFECGHWCTDNVFLDLIRLKTKSQNYLDNQLILF